METRPSIVAEVVILSHCDGGRQTPVASGYRPHIVIQDRSVRVATKDDNGMSDEDYLGVCFIEVPPDYNLGEAAELELELMYWPRVDYSRVIPGATFTIREGGRIVGHGQVVSRLDNPTIG